MKILMGSSYFASHSGGLDLVAGMLFKEFSALGQEIVWMAGDVTPPPNPTGQGRTVSLPVWNFVENRTGIPFPIPSLASLRTIIREVRKADILLLHDCLYLSNIFAFLVAKWRRIPIVLIQHIGFIPYRSAIPNLILRLGNTFVTRPMLSRASQVVFISDITRRFFQRLKFRTPPTLIFNGVDTKTFRPREGAETGRAIRCQFDLPEDGVIILFVGRFVEKKGIHLMQRMATMRPDWTWAFAGWGPTDPRLWQLPNVRVFAGLRGDSLAPLYRCSNLLVLPSTGEGFPLVIQEALASGLPVVCAEETIGADPKMTAFITAAPVYSRDDQRTATKFLSEIDRVLSLESPATRKTEDRRAFTLAHYSWRHAAEQYLEVITRAVSVAGTPNLQPRESGRGLPQ